MALLRRYFKQNTLKTVYIFLICLTITFILWKITNKRRLKVDSSEVLGQPLVDLGERLACLGIAHGDVEGVASEDLSKLLKQRRRPLIPESFYLNATQDCIAFIKARGFRTDSPSKEEKDFPIAYSVVVHEKIEMFERLLRAVYMPQNVYCIHVDKKSSDTFFKAVEAIVACFPNVFVSSKLETMVYASWSRVQADLNCMKDLLNSPVHWRYLLNTCGTDFPIKTNAEMVRILSTLQGKNSMESETPPQHKEVRWRYAHYVADNEIVRTDIMKNPSPISTPMFSGNAYFVLSRMFVENLFSNPEAKAFIQWEMDTYSPDEHLWATLQRMPSMPGFTPPNSKYDMTDMVSIARLVKWSYLEGDVRKGAPYPPCDGIHRRSVCVYGAGDLHWMLTQHHLMANKFDPEVDDVALTCLEHYLQYKSQVGSL